MIEYAEFFSGLLTMGFTVCAAFFFKFWRRTADWLFLVFASAFLLLALNQALTTMLGLPVEERSWLYLLRLAAFVSIILAIVGKNFQK